MTQNLLKLYLFSILFLYHSASTHSFTNTVGLHHPLLASHTPYNRDTPVVTSLSSESPRFSTFDMLFSIAERLYPANLLSLIFDLR